MTTDQDHPVDPERVPAANRWLIGRRMGHAVVHQFRGGAGQDAGTAHGVH